MSGFKQRIEAQRKAIAERNASYERAYKFKVGKTHLRILPDVKNSDNDFWREYGAHYIKDPRTKELIAVVGDAEITYKTACPIREAVGQLIAQANEHGDDSSVASYKDWLAKPVFVVNAQIVGGVDEENKGKVVRCEFSSASFDKILSALDDVMDQKSDFDPSHGIVVTVERTGTGQKDTRYSFTPHLSQPSAPPKSDVMGQALDLDLYVDAKFGASVNVALTKLSVMLGHDVSSSAIGSALREKTAIADTRKTEVQDASFEDVLDGDDVPPFDDAKTSKKGAAKPPADEFEDILADIDDL